MDIEMLTSTVKYLLIVTAEEMVYHTAPLGLKWGNLPPDQLTTPNSNAEEATRFSDENLDEIIG